MGSQVGSFFNIYNFFEHILHWLNVSVFTESLVGPRAVFAYDAANINSLLQYPLKSTNHSLQCHSFYISLSWKSSFAV